jgi:hypothetical protein
LHSRCITKHERGTTVRKRGTALPATWEAQLIARKNAFTNALNVLDIAEANYRRAKQEKDATQQTTSRKT